MSLNKEFFNRETSITAKVVADSINENGDRITTFEIEYPRIVMSEFNTHRAVSKNSSSSRAIPVEKMLHHTLEKSVKPVYFGSKQSGMQAGRELTGEVLHEAEQTWYYALNKAVDAAKVLDRLGAAKEVTNRLVEPFQLVKVVCTATDWDNYFNLRFHPDADPNICMLAYKMYESVIHSKPQLLKGGQWHLPYVNSAKSDALDSMGNHYEDLEYYVGDFNFLSLEDAIKYSAASCASVSYRTEGMTLEKSDKIFDMLIKAEVVHSSPLEHQATPIKERVDGLGIVRINCIESNTWEDGVTHMNRQGQLCSGNLRGFVQYRHLLPDNTNWKFNFEDRMKMFD